MSHGGRGQSAIQIPLPECIAETRGKIELRVDAMQSNARKHAPANHVMGMEFV